MAAKLTPPPLALVRTLWEKCLALTPFLGRLAQRPVVPGAPPPAPERKRTPAAPRRRTAPRRKRLGQGLLAMNVMLGMSPWEAAGLAAEAGDLDQVQPLWDRYARRVIHTRTLMKALEQVAKGSPATASLWLKTWLTGRRVRGDLTLRTYDWSNALPAGLDLEGDLFLDYPTFATLPPNLRIGRHLCLSRSGLRTLPPGLEIGEGLWLRGCRDWDGRIPADARGGFRVFTDRHEEGLPLATWRAKYPWGERAEAGPQATRATAPVPRPRP